MSEPRSVTIGWVEHGDLRTGIWCATCALPSAVEVDLYLLSAAGTISPLGTATMCPDCDWWDWP